MLNARSRNPAPAVSATSRPDGRQSLKSGARGPIRGITGADWVIASNARPAHRTRAVTRHAGFLTLTPRFGAHGEIPAVIRALARPVNGKRSVLPTTAMSKGVGRQTPSRKFVGAGETPAGRAMSSRSTSGRRNSVERPTSAMLRLGGCTPTLVSSLRSATCRVRRHTAHVFQALAGVSQFLSGK